ncbi:MAG: FAD-dependent oxidoreductase [Deltaproteobacteria bacterium]|nr:FAD-dependent oxidoreductase [Deltaproteobacteria bacterium]
MHTHSVWQGTSAPTRFPSLRQDLRVDVAVLGAGITGITAAAVLAERGLKVAVLEARTVGFGTTGNSTGNLYQTVDSGLRSLVKRWGEETAGRVAASRGEAVRFIEETARRHGIACAFGRRPFVQGAASGAELPVEEVEAEYEVLRRLGLPVRWIETVPLPFTVAKAYALENQAQFHPLEYVRRLAEAIASPHCRIFEDSPATDVDRKEGVVQVGPYTVTATHVVMATHVPKGFNLVQTKVFPYREYGVAATLRGAPPAQGAYWLYSPKKASVRFLEAGGRHFAIVVGGHHKVGHGRPAQALAYVEDVLRNRFDPEEPLYRWSAQSYRPADGLPVIGPSPGAERAWIATGFSTDGLTYGTLAGRILGDWISTGSSPWADLYKARFTPVKSAKDFLVENVDVVGQFVKDYLAGEKAKSVSQVLPGEGRLVDVEGHTLAVYRSEEGALTALSPVCTHLKCKVHWNEVEESWDCPCHGSRFAWNGSVLEGPALAPLERHEL